ncbi:MAG: G1 family glutamic endopeptidase [Ktedonobacterales bacterium]
MKRRIIFAPLALAAVAALAISLVFVSGVASAHASVPQRIYHGAPRIRADGTAESTNWSAYAVTGANGAYTSVSGSWVEPTVTCSRRQTAYSSFWVGLDGYNSDSVEQLGTDSDCSRGTPKYYGWWEMYPNPSEELSTSTYPVSAGDTLTASVTFSGSSSYTLYMHSSRGWTFTTTQSGSFDRSSAEWIAEAPSSCSSTCTVLPLADFGTVNFSSCLANNDTIGSYGSSVWEEITMVTSTGTVKAQPSALNSGGNGFSDTWHHS